MSKDTHTDSDLQELMDVNNPVIDRLQNDPTFAALVIGAKVVEDPETKQVGMLTVVSASGIYDVLEDGLYAELANQIEEGNLDLFITLRNVLKDVAEDFDLQNIEETENEQRISH